MTTKQTEAARGLANKAEGERLREEIDRMGGPTELAKKVGVSATLWYKYVDGSSRMGRELEHKLAEQGVDTNYIRTGLRGDIAADDDSIDHMTGELLRDLDMAEQMAEITIDRIKRVKEALTTKRKRK